MATLSEQNRIGNARRNPYSKKANEFTDRLNNPNASAERSKKWRTLHGSVNHLAIELDERRDPISVECDAVYLTCDFHIPFVHRPLVKLLISDARERGIKTLMIAGDFWDCDNYSKFLNLTPLLTFEQEKEAVRSELSLLMRTFKSIFICRGNHERRWLDINGGKLGMRDLYALVRPPYLSEDRFNKRVKITLDDHMVLYQNEQEWYVCHPKNYRQTPLSVARELASKYLKSIFAGHSHQLNQGKDKSGRFDIIDGGGLFDKNALEYLRDTTTYPESTPGFYSLVDGIIETFHE